MGNVNKPSTKLESAFSNETKILQSLTNTKLNSNDIAIEAGSNMRIVALKADTYNDLRDLASQSTGRETFDSIIRKCIEAYKNKKGG
jgi:hypothetical protein